MKLNALLALIVLFVGIQFTNAQISFNTGDASLEAELNLLNDNAKKDLTSFKSQIVSDFGLTKEKVQDLLDKSLEPAEIILSGRIADITGNSVDDVVKSYEANKDKGWGQIAKDLGIKPGSPEFHALKGKSNKGKGKGNGNPGKGKGKK